MENPEPTTERGLLEVTASKAVERDGEKVVAQATVTWNPGASIDEAVALYGEETIYDLYTRAANIKLQAQMRTRIEQGIPQEEIEGEFSDWRPDVQRQVTRDPKAAVISNFNKLDSDQREALLAMLRESLGQ